MGWAAGNDTVYFAHQIVRQKSDRARSRRRAIRTKWRVAGNVVRQPRARERGTSVVSDSRSGAPPVSSESAEGRHGLADLDWACDLGPLHRVGSVLADQVGAWKDEPARCQEKHHRGASLHPRHHLGAVALRAIESEDRAS